MDTDRGFGARLRYERDRRRKTQEEMALVCGVSRRAYQSYEQGQRLPPDPRVRDIARRLRVSYTWLASGALAAVLLLALVNVACLLGIVSLAEPFCLRDEIGAWIG
jgi:transcriptional regulator with XRE-family HTH domain